MVGSWVVPFPIHFFIRGAKLPAAPQSRRKRIESDSPSLSPALHRKLAMAMPPDGPVSRPQVAAPQKPTRESRSGSMYSDRSHASKVVKGEGTPPTRFERTNSHSDFLKQVADKLADRSTTSTAVSGSESVSPAETPMLPTLSPASSVATFVFVSTSDSSGLSSDEEDYRRRRHRSYSGSGASGNRRDRGSGMSQYFFSLVVGNDHLKGAIHSFHQDIVAYV